MSTENQIEANRQNAQHCTGPKTEEGKNRSSQNALKTGLYSQKEVIATESREDFEALAAEYYDHFAPATPQERSLVDALVRLEWLSRRYMAADTALWNYCMEDHKVPRPGAVVLYQSESLSRVGRYFNNARKGYATSRYRTISESTTYAEIGFVPSTAAAIHSTKPRTRRKPPQPSQSSLKTIDNTKPFSLLLKKL